MEKSDYEESGYTYGKAENVVLGEELLHCGGIAAVVTAHDFMIIFYFSGLNNAGHRSITLKAGRVSSLVACICDRIRPFWCGSLGQRRLDHYSVVRMLPSCGL